MFTNALSKVPVKYHKGLRNGLLFAAFFAFDFGFLSYMGFTEENETITKETGHLFWKKTTETTIHHDLSERIPYLIEAIVLILVAVVCLVIALRLTQLSGEYKKYLAIIKGNDKLLIQQISDITNSKSLKNTLQMRIIKFLLTVVMCLIWL